MKRVWSRHLHAFGIAVVTLTLFGCGDTKHPSPNVQPGEITEKPATMPSPTTKKAPLLTDSRPEEAMKAYELGLAENSTPKDREAFTRSVAESPKVVLVVRERAMRDLLELKNLNVISLRYLADTAASLYLATDKASLGFQRFIQPGIESGEIVGAWADEAKAAFVSALTKAICDNRKYDYDPILAELNPKHTDYIPELADLIRESLKSQWPMIEVSFASRSNEWIDVFPDEIYKLAAEMNSPVFRNRLDGFISNEVTSFGRVVTQKALVWLLEFPVSESSEGSYMVAVRNGSDVLQQAGFDRLSLLVVSEDKDFRPFRIERIMKIANQRAQIERRGAAPELFVRSLLREANNSELPLPEVNEIQEALLSSLLSNSILLSGGAPAPEMLSDASFAFFEVLRDSETRSETLFINNPQWVEVLRQYDFGFDERFESFMLPLMRLSALIGNESSESVSILGNFLKDSPLRVAYAAMDILCAVYLREGNDPMVRDAARNAVSFVVDNASSLPEELVNRAQENLKRMNRPTP